MADLTFNELMTAHMDAVRAKSGVTGKLSIAAATEAVNGITSGGGGTGSSDVEYGYIDDSGNFQPLDLSGDTPVATGTAESMASLDMFKTGVNEPSYPSGGGSSDGGGGLEFYECAGVGSASNDIIVSGIQNSDFTFFNGTYKSIDPTGYGDGSGTQALVLWLKDTPNDDGKIPCIIGSNEFNGGYIGFDQIDPSDTGDPEGTFPNGYCMGSGELEFIGIPYDTSDAKVIVSAEIKDNYDLFDGVLPTLTIAGGDSDGSTWSGYKMTWTAIGNTDVAQSVETIAVSGYGSESSYSYINGSYKLEDEESLGASRRFVCAENNCHISFDDAELNPFSSWILFDTSDDMMVYAMANGDESIEEICSLEWDSLQIPDTEMGTITYVVEAQGGDSTSAFGWVKSDTLTEGLTVGYLTPKVGEIYSADTSIRVRKMYDGTTNLIPLDGLLCHFTMDDTANSAIDAVHGITLDAYGAIKNGVEGILGTCWQATASGDYLAGTQDKFTLPAYGFTLNLFAANMGGSSHGTIVDFGDNNDGGLGLWCNGGNSLEWRIGSKFTSTPNAVPTELTMITFTYDLHTVNIYFDGLKIYSRDYESLVVEHSPHIGMFKRENFSDYFLGRIDEVALWDYAMSFDEVLNLYNSYKSL